MHLVFRLLLLLLPVVQATAQHNTDALAVVQLNDRYGYINTAGKMIIPAVYSEASSFTSNRALVKDSAFHGIINSRNQREYDLRLHHESDAIILQNGFIIVSTAERWVETELPNTTLLIPGSAQIFDRDFNQFGDAPGLVAVKPFTVFPAAFKNDQNKWGFLGEYLRPAIPAVYDDAESFSEGRGAVKQNNKWGFVDRSGKLVIPAVYEKVLSFSEGLAAVKQNGKYGFIDTTGKIIIPFQFAMAQSFHDGIACASVEGKEEITVSDESTIIEQTDARWGAISKSGKWEIKPAYKYDFSFHEKMAVVCTENGMGTINRKGKILITPRFKDLGDFSCGMAPARESEKFGFVNKKGKWVIQPQFDAAESFSKVKL